MTGVGAIADQIELGVQPSRMEVAGGPEEETRAERSLLVNVVDNLRMPDVENLVDDQLRFDLREGVPVAIVVVAGVLVIKLGRIGAFGGMVRVPPGYRQPVLVLSTDGVGTKVLVARDAGRFDGVGEDLVNHSVNDILVHGARPLAFLDYVAGAGQ